MNLGALLANGFEKPVQVCHQLPAGGVDGRPAPVFRNHSQAVRPDSYGAAPGVRYLSDRSGARGLMFYTIRHITKFRYSAPGSESIMELRMQPRTEGTQRCLNFQLSVLPRARVAWYRDYLSNTVHHFDVPGQHRQLVIVAEALVDVH